MMPGEQPRLKYVATKIIQDNWSYISVPEFSTIIGVKQTVQKIMLVVDKDGKPIMGQDGLPQFSVYATTVVKAMSNEDWIVEKKMVGFQE